MTTAYVKSRKAKDSRSRDQGGGLSLPFTLMSIFVPGRACKENASLPDKPGEGKRPGSLRDRGRNPSTFDPKAHGHRLFEGSDVGIVPKPTLRNRRARPGSESSDWATSVCRLRGRSHSRLPRTRVGQRTPRKWLGCGAGIAISGRCRPQYSGPCTSGVLTPPPITIG